MLSTFLGKINNFCFYTQTPIKLFVQITCKTKDAHTAVCLHLPCMHLLFFYLLFLTHKCVHPVAHILLKIAVEKLVIINMIHSVREKRD